MHRAGLPAKLPPAVNIDELARPDPLPSSFDKPLRAPYFDNKLSKDPLDLDPPSDSPPQLHDNDTHNDKSDDLAKDQERNRAYMIGRKKKMTTLMTTMSFWSSLFLRFTPLCLPNVHSLSCTLRPKTRPRTTHSMRMSKTALCPLLLQQNKVPHTLPLLLTKYLGAMAKREEVGLMLVGMNSITWLPQISLLSK